jgi:hypothetical protein
MVPAILMRMGWRRIQSQSTRKRGFILLSIALTHLMRQSENDAAFAIIEARRCPPTARASESQMISSCFGLLILLEECP